MKKIIEIGPDHLLTPELVKLISEDTSIKIVISQKAKVKILKSRRTVENMVNKKKIVYGVTTGFGSFKDKAIHHDDIKDLQRNLIRSHSTGVGPFLSNEQVRAAMVVRLNSLSQGYSGVRMELIDLLKELINKNVVPLVPSQGSVGSSGDLAPLSHMGLVLMGEGQAIYKGEKMLGAQALKKAGLRPIEFQSKEGLAFNNGTSVMTGIASITLVKAKNLLDLADMSCALTLEAICGVSSAFDKRIHEIRPHPGQQKSAEQIRKFIKGSKLINSVKNRIQDSYSVRCTPQVHGAARDAISYVEQVTLREINSVTDNPLIFSKENEAISGGNFHGEPIAIAFDVLAIAISEIANISERRTSKLVDPNTNGGLPAFLISNDKAGLHSGLMISQYTAAALVSENKVLAHPASVDSIPTSANQEDHVSMGTIAARKATQIVENVLNVIAIEYMTACQALDFRNKKLMSPKTLSVHKIIRTKVPYLSNDRELSPDIYSIISLFDKILEKIIN
jgi:histidine ammonia-lyase